MFYPFCVNFSIGYTKCFFHEAQASQNMKFDLNGDGKISTADIQVIINEMKK